MHKRIAIAAAAVGLLAGVIVRSALRGPTVLHLEAHALREYAGAYQWEADHFLYLQPWSEFLEKTQIVAFDDSGEVRALYATARDRFFAGRSFVNPTAVESRIEFHRDSSGRIASLTWQRDGTAPRTARRMEIERHEDVRFPSGDVQLAGTLIRPIAGDRHPAVILVHGSGAADRWQVMPFARLLARRGIAILGYDKRGVGASSGDWKTASFDELAGDVVAAVEYLKSRRDIDSSQIGLLGLSQAGWVMPLAALRAKDTAYLISVSGAGVPVFETTLDQTQNELTARGMRPDTVQQIVSIMKLQYRFARTGEGWDEYMAALDNLAARIGPPPETFPRTKNHPQWNAIRLLYFHDPGPTLRQLRVPTLAIFGELDNNILAAKNKAAWEAALSAAGNPDYTLRVLPRANHYQMEARVGSNAEAPALMRFVPEYFTTVHEWLARRINGYR